MNAIINQHVVDTSNIAQAPDLRDVASYLYSQRQSALYDVIRNTLQELSLLKTENKNLRAWHQVAQLNQQNIGS